MSSAENFTQNAKHYGLSLSMPADDTNSFFSYFSHFPQN